MFMLLGEAVILSLLVQRKKQRNTISPFLHFYKVANLFACVEGDLFSPCTSQAWCKRLLHSSCSFFARAKKEPKKPRRCAVLLAASNKHGFSEAVNSPLACYA